MHLVVGQDGHGSDTVPLSGELLPQLFTQAAVHFLKDLVDARKLIAHHLLRPALQRLGHDRMVGIGYHPFDNRLRILPGESLLVHENAHQFRDGQPRMRIVDVNDGFIRQAVQVLAKFALVSGNDILYRRGSKEIMLV